MSANLIYRIWKDSDLLHCRLKRVEMVKVWQSLSKYILKTINQFRKMIAVASLLFVLGSQLQIQLYKQVYCLLLDVTILKSNRKK